MNNDLISRAAAIDYVLKCVIQVTGEYAYGAVKQLYEDAFTASQKSIADAIRNVPAVDAEPVRHGRWEVNMVTDYKAYPAYTYKSGYKCSLCGRRERTNKEPYCHCGARMDEEVDD